jgi:hypothetical protein
MYALTKDDAALLMYFFDMIVCQKENAHIITIHKPC